MKSAIYIVLNRAIYVLRYRIARISQRGCCDKITRFHLPNRRFSHEQTRQEISWEVRRRSPPLIAFRLIVRGIPLLQSVLDQRMLIFWYIRDQSFPLI